VLYQVIATDVLAGGIHSVAIDSCKNYMWASLGQGHQQAQNCMVCGETPLLLPVKNCAEHWTRLKAF
jgi:hypothetical protein